MENTIIAVYGTQSQGKTSTIRETLSTIERNFPKAQVYYQIDNGDVLATIQLGKVKIGIESQGDPNSRILYDDTLRLLAWNNGLKSHKTYNVDALRDCHIILCATRTSGPLQKRCSKQRIITITTSYGRVLMSAAP